MAKSVENGEPFQRQPAVVWLSPGELSSAALRIGLSAAFGEYSDKRETEVLFPSTTQTLTPDENGEVWIDLVSDTGDGFPATYAVAHLLSQPSLDFGAEHGVLPRGQALLHGGDLVYPTASAEEYQNRFIGPYEAALPAIDGPDEERPQLLAIPGNHDWYDGLTAFIRAFCNGNNMAGWKTPQSRSYFAVQLTEDWWAWGIDIQFDGFIDGPQLDYFKEVGQQMKPGASIVLLTAKPSWQYTKAHHTERPTAKFHNLDYLIRKCVPADSQIPLMASGDLHHYARHLSTNGRTYVTAGGGGAYLTLTHNVDDEITLRKKDAALDETLKLQTTYPTKQWSRRRRWHGPLSIWNNRSFGMFIGSLYWLVAFLSLGSLPNDTEGFLEAAQELKQLSFLGAWKSAIMDGLSSPGNIALTLAFVYLFVKVARAPGTAKGMIVGAIHGVLQMLGIFLSMVVVALLVPTNMGLLSWLLVMVGFFVAGTIIGATIYGTYLTVAEMLGLHAGDLSSAQRIEDKKHFLRMKVSAEEIEVWAIGIDNVPKMKAWKFDPDATGSTPRFKLDNSAVPQNKPYEGRVVDHFKVRRRI